MIGVAGGLGGAGGARGRARPLLRVVCAKAAGTSDHGDRAAARGPTRPELPPGNGRIVRDHGLLLDRGRRPRSKAANTQRSPVGGRPRRAWSARAVGGADGQHGGGLARRQRGPRGRRLRCGRPRRSRPPAQIQTLAEILAEPGSTRRGRRVSGPRPESATSPLAVLLAPRHGARRYIAARVGARRALPRRGAGRVPRRLATITGDLPRQGRRSPRSRRGSPGRLGPWSKTRSCAMSRTGRCGGRPAIRPSAAAGP